MYMENDKNFAENVLVYETEMENKFNYFNANGCSKISFFEMNIIRYQLKLKGRYNRRNSNKIEILFASRPIERHVMTLLVLYLLNIFTHFSKQTYRTILSS